MVHVKFLPELTSRYDQFSKHQLLSLVVLPLLCHSKQNMIHKLILFISKMTKKDGIVLCLTPYLSFCLFGLGRQNHFLEAHQAIKDQFKINIPEYALQLVTSCNPVSICLHSSYSCPPSYSSVNLGETMSSSNCCFLTCTQVSQKTGRVVWYSHFFKNYSVCCDPHKALAQ